LRIHSIKKRIIGIKSQGVCICNPFIIKLFDFCNSDQTPTAFKINTFRHLDKIINLKIQNRTFDCKLFCFNSAYQQVPATSEKNIRKITKNVFYELSDYVSDVKDKSPLFGYIFENLIL
jgi:hypothetical protein